MIFFYQLLDKKSSYYSGGKGVRSIMLEHQTGIYTYLIPINYLKLYHSFYPLVRKAPS